MNRPFHNASLIFFGTVSISDSAIVQNGAWPRDVFRVGVVGTVVFRVFE